MVATKSKAKAEAPAPVEEPKPETASLPKVFVIPEETVKKEVKRRKGHAKPHRLQPVVKDSAERDAHVGIPLDRNDKGELVDSEGVGVTAVMAGLRTAARQLDLSIKIWDKSDLETPYVAFKATRKPEPEPEAETVEETAAAE